MSDVTQSSLSARPAPSALVALPPLVLIVFLGCLAIGIPLPPLAFYVHDTLGFDPVMVGWVIGSQSLATVMTRHLAGTMSDARGPRTAVLLGLAVAAASGLLYLLSALLPAAPMPRLAVLIAGRLTMGFAESLFLTGAMSWSITRMGPARTGKVMAWQGIAMYSAIGLGAPIGLAVQTAFGFGAVAVLAILTPLVAALIAFGTRGVPAVSGGRVPFHKVLGLIWRPGLVLTLSAIPFACLASFLALDYAAQGWAGAGLAMSAFAVGYVAVRLFGANLPDRFGGVTVAGASLAVEAVGQGVLWLAPNPTVALIGAVCTGLGYSLIFPAMGVEATRRVAPELRGRAVGNFIAFFDVALGITGPTVGLVVGHHGLATAFLVGMLATLAGLAVLPAVRRM